MIPTFIRFDELKARGIADSWAQLASLQKHQGFPPGRLLSPQVRAWTEQEVADWLDNRPTDKAPPRGVAKKRAEASRSTQGAA